VVAIGELLLETERWRADRRSKGRSVRDLFQENTVNIKRGATERSVVFRINVPDFYYVLASHHELAQVYKEYGEKSDGDIRG